MKKILEYNPSTVTSYPHTAVIMSLLESRKPLLPRLLTHYIQLAYYRAERLDFNICWDITEFIKNYPLVEYNKIHRGIIHKLGISPEKFITSSIDLGYYVYLLVDHFNIKLSSENYKQKHLYHDLLIFGYDSERKVFYIGEFFNENPYSVFEVSFEEILGSFEHPFFDWFEGVHLIKLKDDIFDEVNYNTFFIKNQLYDYVHSIHTYNVSMHDMNRRNVYAAEFVYGISIYDVMITMMNNAGTNDGYLDIRAFYIIYEHKLILLKLVQDLYLIGKLKRANHYYILLSELKQEILAFRNLAVKYNVAKKPLTLDRLIAKCPEIKEREYELFVELERDILDHSQAEVVHNQSKIKAGDINIESVQGEYALVQDRYGGYIGVLKKHSEMQFIFFGTDLRIVLRETSTDQDFEIYIDNKLQPKRIEADQGVTEICFEELERGYHLFRICTHYDELKFQYCEVKVRKDAKNIGTSAALSGTDLVTQGEWKESYGRCGYYIPGSTEKMPPYLVRQGMIVRDADMVVLSYCYSDDRALAPVQSNNRLGSYLLHTEKFEIELFITGNEARKVSFYFVDYEKFGRRFTIGVCDAENGSILTECHFNEYETETGIYVSLYLKGHIKVKFVKNSGPDVTLSGVFFD
ncbi:hypothetical protein [Paenibacillus tepidiphilus]|uniref:hypothetical protein n=1 Tax=Paenibacillus tepidiphilus TaxID=2608683 RepID=UPI00123B70E4|nr:hypothetical protein [Paenibacillus tepidiphilus]